jgi:hypothetical protein
VARQVVHPALAREPRRGPPAREEETESNDRHHSKDDLEDAVVVTRLSRRRRRARRGSRRRRRSRGRRRPSRGPLGRDPATGDLPGGPVKNARYPGNRGSTHGERNETSPAAKARGIARKSDAGRSCVRAITRQQGRGAFVPGFVDRRTFSSREGTCATTTLRPSPRVPSRWRSFSSSSVVTVVAWCPKAVATFRGCEAAAWRRAVRSDRRVEHAVAWGRKEKIPPPRLSTTTSTAVPPTRPDPRPVPRRRAAS